VELSSASALVHVLDRVLTAEVADLPEALLSALTEVIPVSVAAYNEVDPRVPLMRLHWHPADFEYPAALVQRSAEIQAEHPIAAYHYASGDHSTWRISDLLNQEEYHAHPFYTEVNAHLGIEHQMAFRLPGPDPPILVVALSRSDRDFSDEERRFCDLLREPLAAAQAAGARVALLHDTLADQVSDHPGSALVAVDGDRLVPLAECADQVATRLTDAEGNLQPALARWLRAARAGDAALDDPLPDRHVFTWSDELGSIELHHIPRLGGHDLLIAHGLDADVRARLEGLGLRPRETEVLERVMAGDDNRDIARRLGIAPATVKKHLESIYRRLGVSTRTAAAAAGYQSVGRTSAPTAR
jgi:DNA-binding CsgD family transcriptional regulator